MCAVPVDGLHKDDLSLEQKVKIQGLVKVSHPVIMLIASFIHYQVFSL